MVTNVSVGGTALTPVSPGQWSVDLCPDGPLTLSNFFSQSISISCSYFVVSSGGPFQIFGGGGFSCVGTFEKPDATWWYNPTSGHYVFAAESPGEPFVASEPPTITITDISPRSFADESVVLSSAPTARRRAPIRLSSPTAQAPARTSSRSAVVEKLTPQIDVRTTTVDIPLVQGPVTIDGNISASWSGGACVGAAIFGGPAGSHSSTLISIPYSYDPTPYLPSGAVITNEEFMLAAGVQYDIVGGFDGGASFSITGGGTLMRPGYRAGDQDRVAPSRHHALHLQLRDAGIIVSTVTVYHAFVRVTYEMSGTWWFNPTSNTYFFGLVSPGEPFVASDPPTITITGVSPRST